MTKGKQEVVASSVFELEGIAMKKDRLWRLKLGLKTVLPESFREYGVRLSLNEEPYETRIADIARRKADVSAENQLFGAEKKKQLKGFDDQVKDVEQELKDALADSPVIEFDGTIEQLTYKDSDTVVVMMIPASAIGELNDNRGKLRDYKIELLRD